MKPLKDYTIPQLSQALEIKRQQERLEEQLEKIGGQSPKTNGSAAITAPPVMQKRRKKFYMTQARLEHMKNMRAKLAAKRMEKLKATSKPKMSPASRAKISAAAKARWARVKALRSLRA